MFSLLRINRFLLKIITNFAKGPMFDRALNALLNAIVSNLIEKLW